VGWDTCVGGLRWGDVLDLMEERHPEWQGYELVEYEVEDFEKGVYTAFLRKKEQGGEIIGE